MLLSLVLLWGFHACCRSAKQQHPMKQHFQLLDSQLPILPLAPSLLLAAAVVVVLGFAALAAAAFGAGLPFVVLFCCAAADASSTLTFSVGDA
jgi:hypothetical protein